MLFFPYFYYGTVLFPYKHTRYRIVEKQNRIGINTYYVQYKLGFLCSWNYCTSRSIFNFIHHRKSFKTREEAEKYIEVEIEIDLNHFNYEIVKTSYIDFKTKPSN